MSPQVTVVGVVTRDRETSLVACLASYLDNCRRHTRTAEFVIADDSSRAESRAHVRAALGTLRGTDSITLRYAGLTERKRFAAVLSKESSVPREVVEFALFGHRSCTRTTGANRNSLLLDTVDSLVLSVDDDTRCRPAAAPDSREAVSFTSAYDPTEFWFFPDRQRVLEALSASEIDLLGSHERLLGRSLATIDGTADPTGRVAITLQGLAGDSGMGSPRYFLTLRGPSRARLLSSHAAYASALQSREVLRTVPQPTIAPTAFCMTTVFGFDNRRLLPPFFPVERNSDGLFGLMVHRYVNGSHVAFLPWTLLHTPEPHRSFDRDEAWTEAAGINIADILIASILSHNAGDESESDEARLTRLGRYFRDLGSLTPADFWAFVGTTQQIRTLAATTLLETHLREHAAAPVFWADDVKRMIATLRETATRGDYVVPRDLREGRDESRARVLTRELVSRYGELLEAWPALVESARRLHAKGRRVSEPV